MLTVAEAALTVTEADPRWAAFLARDPAADGRFVVAVLSTGIYCRPTCPARRPKPENVRFFALGVEAVRAGFRACKRCRPEAAAPVEMHRALVADACRTIESRDTAPSLAMLARDAGLSAFHFHRIFKAATGITPKAYAAAERSRRMQAALDSDTSVTAAIYDAGYGSNSRFYATAEATLGMTPTAYRRGGAGVTIRFAVAPCSLGHVLVAATPRGLCAIALGDDAAALVAELRQRFGKATLVADDPAFRTTVDAVVALVAAPQAEHGLPLDIAGTAFQRRVWEALRAIPAGETASYATIAARIGQPKAARAVAAACAANTLAVAIPCHRVVHGSGSASGYRWGVARKRALLAREARAD